MSYPSPRMVGLGHLRDRNGPGHQSFQTYILGVRTQTIPICCHPRQFLGIKPSTLSSPSFPQDTKKKFSGPLPTRLEEGPSEPGPWEVASLGSQGKSFEVWWVRGLGLGQPDCPVLTQGSQAVMWTA